MDKYLQDNEEFVYTVYGGAEGEYKILARTEVWARTVIVPSGAYYYLNEGAKHTITCEQKELWINRVTISVPRNLWWLGVKEQAINENELPKQLFKDWTHTLEILKDALIFNISTDHSTFPKGHEHD